MRVRERIFHLIARREDVDAHHDARAVKFVEEEWGILIEGPRRL